MSTNIQKFGFNFSLSKFSFKSCARKKDCVISLDELSALTAFQGFLYFATFYVVFFSFLCCFLLLAFWLLAYIQAWRCCSSYFIFRRNFAAVKWMIWVINVFEVICLNFVEVLDELLWWESFGTNFIASICLHLQVSKWLHKLISRRK